MPPPDPDVFTLTTTLQLLDDAITYRQHRLTLPCPGCAPARHCPQHAGDQNLITGYRDRYDQALRDLLADIDPAQVTRFLPLAGDALPTAEAIAVLYAAALRDLAGMGPFVTPDGRTLIVVPDDPPTAGPSPPASPGHSAGHSGGAPRP